MRLDVGNIFQHLAPSRGKMVLPAGLVEDSTPYN